MNEVSQEARKAVVSDIIEWAKYNTSSVVGGPLLIALFSYASQYGFDVSVQLKEKDDGSRSEEVVSDYNDDGC